MSTLDSSMSTFRVSMSSLPSSMSTYSASMSIRCGEDTNPSQKDSHLKKRGGGLFADSHLGFVYRLDVEMRI